MYNNHYKFKQKPFELTPDPEFIWLNQEHVEMISQFKAAVRKNEGILVMTGDVGTGKTIFTNYLLTTLENKMLSVLIPYPDLDCASFFKYLADELGMNREFGSKGDFLIHFDHFLREIFAKNTGIMIIVDDAQNMSTELMVEIRHLARLKINGNKLIRILFVGQSQNNADFTENIKTDLKLAVSFSHHLNALTKSETHDYIRYRLKKAGAAANLFASDGIDEIYSYSGGCQRLINIVCDDALLAGYSEGLHEIKKTTIINSINELRQYGT